MKLREHENIVGAWAERCVGPGWSNRLIWVCIRSALDCSHRVDALQPEEHPDPGAFGIYAAASEAMISDAIAATVKPKRRRASRAGRGEGP